MDARRSTNSAVFCFAGASRETCGPRVRSRQNSASKLAAYADRTNPAARSQRGSVLMIVLITVLFATVALFAFIERASNDLLVEKRSADASRLRLEAYSALETTLAVLEDFRLTNGSLRSPAEGWSDPLAFAGYEPAEGRTVEITFEDESGKFSLPHATQTTLVNLFDSWGIAQSDAATLADAVLGWMKKDYVATTASAPEASDYESEEIPFSPPGRPLRSFSELAAIGVTRDVFYDEAGQPNDLWQRFVNAFSLFSYQTPSINGASPELFAGLGVSDTMQQRQLDDYLHGTGEYKNKGAGYFKSSQEVAAMLGAKSPVAAMGTQIMALRIVVTVREGRSSFRINALVAPPGGATIPVVQANQSASSNQSGSANPPPASNNATPPPAKKLNYPFTILEFRENDEMPSPSIAVSP